MNAERKPSRPPQRIDSGVRPKVLGPEDFERRALIEYHDGPSETGDTVATVSEIAHANSRADRLRSQRRRRARLQAAELFSCAMRESQTSNYEAAAMLDLGEHAVRDVRAGLRPLEISFIWLVDDRLRDEILKLLLARFELVKKEEL